MSGRIRTTSRMSNTGYHQRRALTADGPFIDTGSPWELMSFDEVAQLHAVRGEYHPILDPLGITSEESCRRRGSGRTQTERSIPICLPVDAEEDE